MMDHMEVFQTLGQNMRVLYDEPMADHTTFRVGGPADLMVIPENVEQLRQAIRLCRDASIPWYVIGNGSNLLVSDKGYRGVVIKICRNMDLIEKEEKDGRLRVRAGAGVLLATLARSVCDDGWTGFEFATGIPGTLGGGITMNAGAYGGEMSQILSGVTVLTAQGAIEEWPADRLELGYRKSRIQKEEAIALEAVMEFEKGDIGQIRETVRSLAAERRKKQPLEYPSAGSTFKRPEGYFAGKLIQDAGLKGYRVGGAQVSEKHSGFVINADHATAADVYQLMRDVGAIVYKKFGVRLEPEVRLLGEF